MYCASKMCFLKGTTYGLDSCVFVQVKFVFVQLNEINWLNGGFYVSSVFVTLTILYRFLTGFILE
jgi:hypothetical protein